jgi:hypothetical protein
MHLIASGRSGRRDDRFAIEADGELGVDRRDGLVGHEGEEVRVVRIEHADADGFALLGEGEDGRRRAVAAEREPRPAGAASKVMRTGTSPPGLIVVVRPRRATPSVALPRA